ncbi:DUF4251 domain-containing protein [Flammeovirga sp. SubArs3]|uniref:DUF4251 domain-containing protein n=1 Tax=Flammeovirga sp. SubArs3 TaxID=2995316 RepID=UPI00248CF929|nr:DUF4251 domain-containing protein [Flammeovirga sp. SubArs3]
MKNLSKNINLAFASLCLILCCSLSSYAQDSTSTSLTKQELKAQKKAEKKANKEKKKAAKLAEEQAEHDKAVTALVTKSFTLQANQAYDRRGQTINVDASLNFVRVEGDRAVVQLAFPQLVGFNGVGGVTVDGNITNYEIKKNEKTGTTSVTFHVQGPTMMANVTIDLEKDGNWANSSVEGDFSAAELNFRGVLVPNFDSDSYEGTTRY